MTTKQQRQTARRKKRQAERREREYLERAAMTFADGPRTLEAAERMSTERLREILTRRGRRRVGMVSPFAGATMAMALAAAIDRNR